MKITVDLPDLQEVVANAVEVAMTDKQTKIYQNIAHMILASIKF